MVLKKEMKHGGEKRDNRILDERSFRNLVKRLSCIIKEKRDTHRSDRKDIEWTRQALIEPLLKALGWDNTTDLIYESGPPGKKGSLDLILNCQTPVGIKTRMLYESPPQNIKHPQIKDGLMQCMAKKVPYFIWTNGDSWQFFSLALEKAAFYEVCLSKAVEDPSLLDRLFIIKKDIFVSDPDRFNKAIIENTELMFLSHAWMATLKNHTKELLNVFRKGLKFANIKDDVILKFLKTFKPESFSPQIKSSVTFEPDALMTQRRSLLSFNPDSTLTDTSFSAPAPKGKNWERLIDSYESHYRLARWFFQTSYYRKLGEYLISEDYKPWSKDSTWRHLGFPDGNNGEKKVRHAVSLFMEWGFIEENDGDKYFRVEGCSPYLKKLLEKTASR